MNNVSLVIGTEDMASSRASDLIIETLGTLWSQKYELEIMNVALFALKSDTKRNFGGSSKRLSILNSDVLGSLWLSQVF